MMKIYTSQQQQQQQHQWIWTVCNRQAASERHIIIINERASGLSVTSLTAANSSSIHKNREIQTQRSASTSVRSHQSPCWCVTQIAIHCGSCAHCCCCCLMYREEYYVNQENTTKQTNGNTNKKNRKDHTIVTENTSHVLSSYHK